MKNSVVTLFAITMVIIVAIVYAYIDGGSPKAAQDARNDMTRSQNVQSLSYSIQSYYRDKSKLPTMLGDLRQSNLDAKITLDDPETHLQYEYLATGDLSYDICVNYATAVLSTNGTLTAGDTNYHDKGRYCHHLSAK